MANRLLASGRKILVTGGTGFLGRRIIQRLVDEGYPVRVLARISSNIEPLKKLAVEIVLGDVGDRASVNQALNDIAVVIHAAAATSRSQQDCESVTVLGTRNVLESCKANGIEKLVYISSCSVYGVADYQDHQVVTEESGLERFPWRRGAYSASKQQAEALVTEAMNAGDFPIVVLRPGTIYGLGGEIFTPMIGLSLANQVFLVFGSGQFVLPLVYVDNVADAVFLCLKTHEADYQIFNVVDTEEITKKRYMEGLVKKLYPQSQLVYLPYWLLYGLTWIQERVFRVLRRPPFLTTYRLVSSQRPIRYNSSKIECVIGWQPRVTFDQATAEMVSYVQPTSSLKTVSPTLRDMS